MTSYHKALSLVPDLYDVDDEIQINNYWDKAGDAHEAWNRLDSLRTSIQTDISDNLRLQMKLSDDHLLLENFEFISRVHTVPPRFG